MHDAFSWTKISYFLLCPNGSDSEISVLTLIVLTAQELIPEATEKDKKEFIAAFLEMVGNKFSYHYFNTPLQDFFFELNSENLNKKIALLSDKLSPKLTIAKVVLDRQQFN